MQFDPFANKAHFQAFTVESSTPCPKCGCTRVLIAPTNNTHAASARCPGSVAGSVAGSAPGCGRFFRWLGKKELESLALQHRNPADEHREAVSAGTAQQSAGTTTPASLGNPQAEAAR